MADVSFRIIEKPDVWEQIRSALLHLEEGQKVEITGYRSRLGAYASCRKAVSERWLTLRSAQSAPNGPIYLWVDQPAKKRRGHPRKLTSLKASFGPFPQNFDEGLEGV
jgi:hypothetical protein